MDQPHAQPLLTPSEAYEACYRFVFQYWQREMNSESLLLMLTDMGPWTQSGERWPERTSDPAQWQDFLGCVRQTLAREQLPHNGPSVVPRDSTDAGGRTVPTTWRQLRRLGQALGLIYRDDGSWRLAGPRRPPNPPQQ